MTDKRTALEQLLASGMVQVSVDPRRAGVELPEDLVDRPAVKLNLSRRFPGYLEIDDAGVRALLRFGGVPFPVVLPWACLFAVVSLVGAGWHVWREDAPPELAEQLAAAARTKLRLVN